MKWLVIETNEENNETFYWEYDTEEAAIENIKHMRIPELQKYNGERTIRLFKAEEVSIDHIEGYTLDELSRRRGEQE